MFSSSRIHRNLVLHLTEMKKAVARWLTSCEKREKTVNVEPSLTHDPVAEYKKLMVGPGFYAFFNSWRLRALFICTVRLV